MTIPFQFQLMDNLSTGVGATRQIDSLLTRHGYHHILILVDEAVAEKSAYFSQIVELVKSNRTVSIERLRGSEVTINAVFTDKTENKKLGINGRFMNATHAILDAEWTSSCPFKVSLSSGMDALVHTLESFMCQQHNELARLFSKAAFRLLYENLPCLVDDPGNLDKRQTLLSAAHLAAISLFNSGSGIAGALSYPIGVHFKVPHGIAGGIFLASVVEFNVKHGYEDYADLLDQIESHPEMDALDKSKRFATVIQSLSERLGVPKYLDPWGITKTNADEVARLMLPLQTAFNQNPVHFSAEQDAREILLKHVMPS